ncbi:MAG: M48 family metallopeptidase [Cyanobacteria bacterium J06649_4]
MNNFFDQQDRAHKLTSYLVFLFVCAVVGTIFMLYGALLLAHVFATNQSIDLWNLDYFFLASAIVCFTVGLGSLQKSQSLRGGGAVVATSMGGVRVEHGTADGQKRELLNVVGEMAIAASMPMPKVYVMPDASINAFAAGHTPQDAVIAVTQGTLDRLNRDELQGVIGHEFSHIANGDIALNLKLLGYVYGLLLLHIAGRKILYHVRFRGRSSRNNKAGNFVFALGMGLMVSGGIGWLFAQMIKSAVSRQREFLADASAVQFTRNSEGLANALRHISLGPTRSHVSSPNAAAASHLFFSPPTSAPAFFSTFATHPPIEERIRRLGAQPMIPAHSSQGKTGTTPIQTHVNHASAAMGVAAFASSGQVFSAQSASHESTGLQSASVSTALPPDLVHAQARLEVLPESLLKGAKVQINAIAIVYGLLLSGNDEIRIKQKQLIVAASPAVLDAIEKLESDLVAVERRSRLPLLELCVPSLSGLTPAAAMQLLKGVKALIQIGGKMSMAAYAFKTVLQYRLMTYFAAAPSPSIDSLSAVSRECQLLLSALARTGHNSPTDADYAFGYGHAQLPKSVRSLVSREMVACSLPALHEALKRVRLATVEVKGAIAQACTHVVLADNKTTDAEAGCWLCCLVRCRLS